MSGHNRDRGIKPDRVRKRAREFIKQAGISPIQGGRTEAAVEFRHRLILAHRDEAFGAFLSTLENGTVDDPVVFLIDARDGKGGNIGRRFFPEGYAKVMKGYREGEGVPVLTMAINRIGAVETLKHINPHVAADLEMRSFDPLTVPFVVMATGESLSGHLTA